tara:strand:+ start:453 stop:863 length:411 start_codon:yes stop_codon:yes gene_type:complete
MKINPIFKGKVIGGHLQLADEASYKLHLQRLSDKEVELIVRRPKNLKLRSGGQNAYMWSVVYGMISSETGQDSETIHEFCKTEFNSKTINIGKREVKIAMSTALLDTINMENYLDKVRLWAAEELSIVIPLPKQIE